MRNVKNLIFEYLNEKDVYTLERILDDLTQQTTEDNFVAISETMLEAPNFHEMDLVIYLDELRVIPPSDLNKYIEHVLLRFKDPKAIEALEEMRHRLEYDLPPEDGPTSKD